MQEFNSAWLPGQVDLQRPDISPLFNPDFTNLPPAIFTVGSDDALYDDSVFGAAKWHMGGNETQLFVFPDAVHGFCRLGGPDAEAALATTEAFILKHSRSS
jgi:acetyl esterase/lipase